MDSIRRDKQWEQIDAGQQPILLAISSKNDWANRALFPLGQLFVSLRKARQRKTLGNCLEYVTHSLLGDPKPDGRSGHDGFWFDRFTAHGLVLQRTGKLHEGNPFMVARTTRDVIDGHNGIWEGKLRDWMIAFLLKLHERASSKAGESSSHR
jgi:hypothetical protein